MGVFDKFCLVKTKMKLQPALTTLARMQARVPGLWFRSAGGVCPFQAEGRLGAVPFYFRSRGGYTSLSIGPDPALNPLFEIEDEEADGSGFMDDAEFEEVFLRLVARLPMQPPLVVGPAWLDPAARRRYRFSLVRLIIRHRWRQLVRWSWYQRQRLVRWLQWQWLARRYKVAGMTLTHLERDLPGLRLRFVGGVHPLVARGYWHGQPLRFEYQGSRVVLAVGPHPVKAPEQAAIIALRGRPEAHVKWLGDEAFARLFAEAISELRPID